MSKSSGTQTSKSGSQGRVWRLRGGLTSRCLRGMTQFGNDRSFPIRPHCPGACSLGDPAGKRRGRGVMGTNSTITHTEATGLHRGPARYSCATVHNTHGRSSQTLLMLRGGPRGSEKQHDWPEVAHVACGCGLGSGSLFSAPISQHPTGQRGQRGPRQWWWEGGKFEPAEKCVWLLLAPLRGAWPREPPSRSDHPAGQRQHLG